ncbi:MAG: exonuclease domain-containing protein [Pseudomonadota bacterium]
MDRPTRGKKFRPYRAIEAARPFVSSSDLDHNLLTILLKDLNAVVFDIETTGGNPEKNGITEISALKFRGGEIVERFYTLVNPQIPIPGIVRRMTGITNKMLKDSPLIDEVMPKFIEFIGADVLVSHNTIGDLKFLRHFAGEVSAHNLDNFFLCTHLLAEKLIPEASDKSLKGLASFLGFAEKESHRAEADAIMTLKLFKELMARIDVKKITTLEQAVRFQGDTESAIRLGWGVQETDLENIPKGPGVFYLFDHNQELLFFSSSYNLQRDVFSLRQLHTLPKHLMKVVLRAHSLKVRAHHNFFSAFLDESKDPRRHQVSFHPHKFHLRSVQCFNIDKEGSKYRVSISSPGEGTVHVFGRVNDQRQAHIFLKDLASIFSEEVTKKGFLVSESDLPLLESLFRGRLEQHETKASERPLEWLKRIFVGEDKSQHVAKLSKLKELKLPGALDTLLSRNGLLFAQGVNEWQVYPVIHGRVEDPVSIKLSPEDWIKSADASTMVEKLLKSEGLPHRPVDIHDEGVVNAVIWALSTSSGRTRDVIKFFDVVELRDLVN